MSNRKFYKYSIELVVLSEKPLGYMSLEELDREVSFGNLVAYQVSHTEEPLTSKDMVEALEDASVDPEFFNLTSEGKDLGVDLTPEQQSACQMKWAALNPAATARYAVGSNLSVSAR